MKNKTKRRIAKNLEIGMKQAAIWLARKRPDGSPLRVVFDALDLPDKRKAGIEFVDAADSKRNDVKADVMMICSNTGFEEVAIAKAKRKKIGLISVLRHGDERSKALIEEQMYFRKIDITSPPMQITWNGEDLPNLNPDPQVLEYMDGSVPAWLQLKAALIAAMNPRLKFPIRRMFTFKYPTEFYKNGKTILLRSMEISFTPQVEWRSEVVQLDASTAIYDYIRGRLKIPSGTNSISISIDFNKGTPLAGPPPTDALGFGINPPNPGELDLALADVHGSPDKDTKIADLDNLIKPDDLRLKFTDKELDYLEAEHERAKVH